MDNLVNSNGSEFQPRFNKNGKNTNENIKIHSYKPTHPTWACIIAATGPEKALGNIEKPTKIENCVAVNRLSTHRISNTTKAVELMPAARFSHNTATENSTIFFPIIAKAINNNTLDA